MNTELCPHGLTESSCSFCISKASRIVYFSAGGNRYHFDINCETFHEGRKKVRDEGGVNAPIETGREHLVKASRDPCWNCRKNLKSKPE
jgi:hypothetical protein